MDLSVLKISDKKREILHQMKIDNVEDLLAHYPFRYEENVVVPFDEWEKGDRVCFEATIISTAHVSRYGYKKSTTRFKVLYDDYELTITLFNRPWTSGFSVGKVISIFGKYEGNYKVTCSNYNSKSIHEQKGLIPVYNAKEGISQNDLRKYITKALQSTSSTNFVPNEYRNAYRLLHKQQALCEIHMPSSKEGLKNSLRTLKYEEFLKFQLQMQYMRSMNHTNSGIHKNINFSKVEAFIESLPFILTDGQRKAMDEILNDMQSEMMMYRLLQGDVGCGKTVVAAIAMFACVLSGYQSALLVPTEILAKQHYLNIKKMFKAYDLHIEVLYSSLSIKQREKILQDLKNGNIDMLIGTHALFQENVEYYNLGLVVADEQHRFGVEQRRKLLSKGDKVDFLLMSATPIPRTLAVSLFGDMDVSTIEEKPSGRKEIITTYVKEDSLRSVLMDILAKVDEGDQCYVVAPAIEKNEEYEIRNVETLYESMKSVLGKKYRLALLHGKLSSEEKNEIMNAFLNHEYDFLISTTVIEVGVDVKDANIMVIYDAHRFGMSQIHQLRGRVGRGERQGYCYLLSGTKEEEAQKRLTLCARIQDGFEIAQADLSLRGPGDLLGVRQSGISGFILGDVIKDINILETARKDALHILSNLNQYPNIREFLNKKDYTSYLD